MVDRRGVTPWPRAVGLRSVDQAMELELSQLDLRYAGLRIRDGQRTGRLVASMSTSGQQAAVLVVRDDDEYVLVDGYARVEALHKLARDLVKAAVLELSQADALIVGYRLDNVRARSVLEEAWLLRELRDAHGMSPTELARKLDRSDSWVSRRLGLVGALPESVQVAVRDGRVSGQVATKYLVPLARANAEACAQLVEGLGERRLSVRDAERVYKAWRRGDAQQRARIVERPGLFVDALRASERVDEATPDEVVAAVVGDLGAVTGICRRVCGRLADAPTAVDERKRRALSSAFGRAREAFGELSARLEGQVS